MLFGVIALPVLVPIAALLQLLFPGILREQWRQYQYVVKVLIAQSTVIFVHWALCAWVFTAKVKPWWLADKYLGWAMVAVAVIGAIVSVLCAGRDEPPAAGEPNSAPTTAQPAADAAKFAQRPTSLEYWAMGVLAGTGLIWAAVQLLGGKQPWDHMAVVTVAALLGLAHLAYRQLTYSPGKPRSLLTTDRVVLAGLVIAGVAFDVSLADANRRAGDVTNEWPTYRGNMQRSGVTDLASEGPQHPKKLWTFDPGVKKGRVDFFSSPTVVNDQVYIGALYEVSAAAQGYVYCINALDGRLLSDKPVKLGERIWTFDAENTLKAVFSSPCVYHGRMYFGEGFHQDQACRLFCIDPADATKTHWSKMTTSHVESTPTIVDNKIYFGAGDDGVYCLELPKATDGKSSSDSPTPVWHVEKIHIDSSPAVTGNGDSARAFVGSVEGDLYKSFEALAIDGKGDVKWRVPAPLPLPASPAVEGDHVYFALGNGKLNENADKPAGAVWCLNAETGTKLWEFSVEKAIFASPIAAGDVVYAVCRDAFCYCLNVADGKPKWKKYLNAPLVASPILAGGKLYVVSATGVVYCLNAADGEIVWTFDQLKSSEEDVFSSPALVDGKLYLAIGGKLHCIGE